MKKFEKIEYSMLNDKAKEMHNFQKVSAVLADYGFVTLWLNNDWNGADFLAVHCDGVTTLKVQLKARMSFNKKYMEKEIWICFIEDGDTFLYPHDELLNKLPKYREAVEKNDSRTLKKIPKKIENLINEYKIN